MLLITILNKSFQRKHVFDFEKFDYETNLVPPAIIIYMLDSGVRDTHYLLEGKILRGAIFFPEFKIPSKNHDHYQNDGHGTFIASILLRGNLNTVIVPLVVLDETGTGESWALSEAVEFAIQHRSRYYPGSLGLMVMCVSETSNNIIDNIKLKMSLLFQDYLEEALEKAHQNEFAVILSAGNSNINACRNRLTPPPSSIIIVGAASNQERALFSNFGLCINIFAKSFDIGASRKDDYSLFKMIGTSVAAPKVANKFALYWLKNANFSAQQVVQSFLSSTDLVDNDYIKNKRCDDLDFEKQQCLETTTKGLID